MDSLARRQTEIVALAKAAGRLSVEDLASRFKLSPQTIRKDLAELSERGVLQRFHGGAIPASGSAQFGHDARRHLATGAKERVGLKAASLIPNGSSVLIYIGTTVEQVARALRDKRGLTVITNDINVVTLLMGYEQIEVIVAGGAVRHRDAGVAGDAAVDFLRQFRADYSLVGTPAIDVDGTLRG
jgi:DeoR family glycerol-3-phosphate regulon repressor